MGKPLTVRRADRALQQAREAHTALEASVVAGDETVTAAAISESAGAVRLAELRLQSAERDADAEASAHHNEAQAARERRRRKAQAVADRERRESWQRAIDDGGARRMIAAHEGAARPNYPAEFDAMLVDAGLLPPLPTDDGPTAA